MDELCRYISVYTSSFNDDEDIYINVTRKTDVAVAYLTDGSIIMEECEQYMLFTDGLDHEGKFMLMHDMLKDNHYRVNKDHIVKTSHNILIEVTNKNSTDDAKRYMIPEGYEIAFIDSRKMTEQIACNRADEVNVEDRQITGIGKPFTTINAKYYATDKGEKYKVIR